MALVLCTGTDRTLIQTRAMVLERGGHTVMTAMGEHELIALCSQKSFDVVVIGHTISPIEKPRILRLVKQYCPRVKVLELFIPARGKTLLDADDWLEAPFTPPDDLAEHVSRLAAKSS